MCFLYNYGGNEHTFKRNNQNKKVNKITNTFNKIKKTKKSKKQTLKTINKNKKNNNVSKSICDFRKHFLKHCCFGFLLFFDVFFVFVLF